jgi:hypothetical protein
MGLIVDIAPCGVGMDMGDGDPRIGDVIAGCELGLLDAGLDIKALTFVSGRPASSRK